LSGVGAVGGEHCSVGAPDGRESFPIISQATIGELGSGLTFITTVEDVRRYSADTLEKLESEVEVFHLD
jgi:hypothetical protein